LRNPANKQSESITFVTEVMN